MAIDKGRDEPHRNPSQHRYHGTSIHTCRVDGNDSTARGRIDRHALWHDHLRRGDSDWGTRVIPRGQWPLEQACNFFVIHTRAAAGSPEAGRSITITRLPTPAERAAQLQLQAKRAAQYRKAQRQKAAAQAAHDRAVAQAQARRHEAEAVANGTSEQAISDPSDPGVGYDDTYPGNFAVEFGFEFGMDFGDKYSSSANIESAIQLEQNTPYQAIKKLGMRTIVRLALKKYAQPIG